MVTITNTIATQRQQDEWTAEYCKANRQAVENIQ